MSLAELLVCNWDFGSKTGKLYERTPNQLFSINLELLFSPLLGYYTCNCNVNYTSFIFPVCFIVCFNKVYFKYLKNICKKLNTFLKPL